MKRVPQPDGTREKHGKSKTPKVFCRQKRAQDKKGTARLHSAEEEDRFSEAPEGERKARLQGDRRDHPQSSKAFVRAHKKGEKHIRS
ncbi:hypothetical protein NPIL_675121 [Nephila pilipes]|uniref:Uncharacterized protein n=1 Tax=Nephila pilipes TaxID=299642 RepID=A0A8X6QBJ1_NEPPI|nr:hypothetical protein NPIL_675121 [Nephila pilipes]